MRLWTLHPSILDKQGIRNLWNDCIEGQKILEGTRSKLPKQLKRFSGQLDTRMNYIGYYMHCIWLEANKRKMKMNRELIERLDHILTHEGIMTMAPLPISRGQVLYEYELLYNDMNKRKKEKDTQDAMYKMCYLSIPFALNEVFCHDRNHSDEREPWEEGPEIIVPF